MPTYEYECTQCAHRFDVVQKFTDAALTTCDDCGGELRKVYSAVGVVFKGSGFYKTDSRGASSASTPSSTKNSDSTSTSDSSSSTTTAAPAATPAAAATDS